MQTSSSCYTQCDKDVWEKLEQDSRHYNIDLAPKILFSSGPEVDLLISSGVARYLEFKIVENTYLHLDGELQLVCTYSTKYHQLHRFHVLRGIYSKVNTSPSWKNEFWASFSRSSKKNWSLQKKELDQNTSPSFWSSKNWLQNWKHSFFMQFHLHKMIKVWKVADAGGYGNHTDFPKMSTKTGLDAMKKYITSLGKYGNTPFISSLYGVSEFPQAFCR